MNMTGPASPAAELVAETAAMRTLLELLQREQTCLSAGDADGCAALLEQKSTQVNALSALAAQRYRRLAALGFAADEKGMTDWLHASPEPLNSDWQALMDVARSAHELNRVNGMLLGQLAARNRLALDALGIRAAGSGLYGPGGQADYSRPHSTSVIG